MSIDPKDPAQNNLDEDFDDFFENSVNGFINADKDGNILRVNFRLADWLGYTPDELKGRRFSELLSIGGRMYFETHLAPLLRMQGYIDEIALELAGKNGERVPVLVNALERRDDDGNLILTRVTAFRAFERRLYEQYLKEAKDVAEGSLSSEKELAALREQFIAVLGHDLRNPLGAIDGGARLLLKSPLNERSVAITKMIIGSTERMEALINDVLDFARTRLGSGLDLAREPVALEPVLLHLIDELRSARPGRKIEAELSIPDVVNCDPSRISQVVSNLIANALTHGASDGTVFVRASTGEHNLEISVANTGKLIPAEKIAGLFEPFTREKEHVGKPGLGLGLFISSEIALAHGGTLSATSSAEETRFTFKIPL